MRIIESKLPRTEIETKCKKCNTKFAYNKNDIKSYPQKEGGGYYVICPICGQYISHNRNPLNFW